MLVVIAVLVMLAILLMNSMARGIVTTDFKVICANNLKQNSTGFAAFAQENGNCFPWQVSATNGGTMDAAIQGNISQTFRLLSAHGFKPVTFICPADKSRRAAESQTAITEQNISYFLNLDVGTNKPARIVASGDRNLRVNGIPVKPGLFQANTMMDLSWTRDLHLTGGTLAFADGHVEFCRTDQLNAKLRDQGATEFRFVVP
ncbi:MAG TPA: hypothetical protein VK327_08000 [Candidatus Paceibacterota bacterium]|nr:hypothetical protein [Candidatus Paceibacterota bacterium]